MFKTILSSAWIYFRLLKSLYGWSQVQNFQSGFSRRGRTSLIFLPCWDSTGQYVLRLSRRDDSRASNSCTLQDDTIKNLIKMKLCLCYSDCKTKQQQPLCSWFPSAPDHEPIPRFPTGLSTANKTNNYCLTVFTYVFTIV